MSYAITLGIEVSPENVSYAYRIRLAHTVFNPNGRRKCMPHIVSLISGGATEQPQDRMHAIPERILRLESDDRLDLAVRPPTRCAAYPRSFLGRVALPERFEIVIFRVCFSRWVRRGDRCRSAGRGVSVPEVFFL